jgi:hypothetical protein
VFLNKEANVYTSHFLYPKTRKADGNSQGGGNHIGICWIEIGARGGLQLGEFEVETLTME